MGVNPFSMSTSFWRKVMIITVVHIAFIAVWWGAVVIGDIPAYILPTPWQALLTLGEENYNWTTHFIATSQEIFGGYILAVVVGVALRSCSHGRAPRMRL